MSQTAGRYFLCLPLLIVAGCAAELAEQNSKAHDPAFSERLAIARAEQFVRVNGYVNPTDADPKRAVREALDRGLRVEDLLAERAGMLLGSACGVSRTVEPTAFVVAFCYDPRRFTRAPGLAGHVRSVGRGVVVPGEGRPPHIVHQDLRLTSSSIERRGGMDELETILRAPAFRAAESR